MTLVVGERKRFKAFGKGTTNIGIGLVQIRALWLYKPSTIPSVLQVFLATLKVANLYGILRLVKSEKYEQMTATD